MGLKNTALGLMIAMGSLFCSKSSNAAMATKAPAAAKTNKIEVVTPVINTPPGDTTKPAPPKKKKNKGFGNNYFTLQVGYTHNSDNALWESGGQFDFRGHVPGFGFTKKWSFIEGGYSLRNKGIGFSQSAVFRNSNGNIISYSAYDYAYRSSIVFLSYNVGPNIDLAPVKKTNTFGGTEYTTAVTLTPFVGAGGQSDITTSGGDNVDMLRLSPFVQAGVKLAFGGKTKNNHFSGVVLTAGMRQEWYNQNAFDFPPFGPNPQANTTKPAVFLSAHMGF